MKVLIYGENIHYTNLPSPDKPDIESLEVTEENIDRLIPVIKEPEVRPFLMALLHLKLSLTAHVTIGTYTVVNANYLFTYKNSEDSEDVFLFGFIKSGNGYRKPEYHRHMFFNSLHGRHTKEEPKSEEFWTEYFINLLKGLHKKEIDQIKSSRFLVDVLEKSGLPA